MAKESIIILSLMGVSFVVMLIGAVLWGLKKKGGVFITVIGFVAFVVTILFVPKGEKSQPEAAEPLDFAECYYAYQENELKADDTYKGNKYSLTVKVRDIQDTDGSLLYWDDEVIVEFEVRVDNTIAVGQALFEKEQRDSLKEISIGDTITFVGECQSIGAWIDCKLQ